jgi:hypothetical protein
MGTWIGIGMGGEVDGVQPSLMIGRRAGVADADPSFGREVRAALPTSA